MPYGFVYVLRNPTMPGIYKIGHTNNSPLQRAADLSSKTSVALPYEVVLYCELHNPREFEFILHDYFSEKRINNKREFFKLSPFDLINLYQYLSGASINHTKCDYFDEIENKYGDDYLKEMV